MPNSREIELKFVVPGEAIDEIQQTRFLRDSAKQEKRLDTVYFDTPDCKLRRVGLSLRTRSDGRNRVQTIKSATGGDGIERAEWETPLAGNEPDFSAFKDPELDSILSKKLQRKLDQLFATHITRTTYSLDDKSVEVALDRGEITAGNRIARVCEVEFELKEGDEQSLFRAAKRLAESAPLRFSTRSKAARGYELAQGAPLEGVFRQSAINLSRRATAADAFHVIAFACLAQVADNCEAVVRGEDEGIHQMRVGLRRLRSAISLFKALLKDPQTEQIKKELKWLTGELGPARQLQVFCSHVVENLHRSSADENALHNFTADLHERLEHAKRRAANAVASKRFREMLLDVAEWVEIGAWNTKDEPKLRNLRKQPAKKLAKGVLSRINDKIAKKGKKLRSLDTRKRHKLRIATKKLRYGSEFFESLFPKKQQVKAKRMFSKRLKALQDCLGELNDVALHKRLCETIAREAQKSQAEANWIGFFAGIAFDREAARIDALLNQSIRAHRKFRKSEAFWT